MKIFGSTLVALTLLSATPLVAQDAKPSAGQPVAAKPIEGYEPMVSAANLAPTAAIADPTAKVNVVGQPRATQGHPCTLWDSEDIDHYKKMLETSKELQGQVSALKAAMDKRITEPLGVPEPKLGPDGKKLFLGDQPPFNVPGSESYPKRNSNLSHDIRALGMLYALTGEAKYGDYCKQILLAYATAFPNYGYSPKSGWPSFHSAIDGRLQNQFLEDAGWLIGVGFGYDLIYNLPSWTPQERAMVHDNLFKPIVDDFRFERFKGTTDRPCTWRRR